LMAPFMFTKWIIAWSAWVICAFVCWVITFFHKKGTPYKGTLKELVRIAFKVTAKVNMVMMGCLSIEVKDTYVDYSKYLGPEWKKEKTIYGKAGSVVANH